MKTRHDQSGFSIVEILLVVAVLAIIGFLGYTFYNNQVNKTASSDQQESSQAVMVSDVNTAPAINSTSDLDAATKTLDQTDPSSSSDVSQLDSELANF